MNPFQRLWIAIASQFRKLATILHLADPIAVRNRQIDRAAESVTNLQGKLEEIKGKCAGLEEGIAEAEGEEKIAVARAKRAKDAGDLAAARLFAADVLAIRTKLDRLRKSYQTANAAYQEKLRDLQRAHDLIVTSKQENEELADRLDLAKLDHSIAGIRDTMNVDGALNLDGKEVTQAVNDQIHRLEAKSQVQQDLQAPASAKDKFLACEPDIAADDLLATL